MTQIKLKSVVEFLFLILLFALALAYFNKTWDLYFYVLIAAFLLILLAIEAILGFRKGQKKKSGKKIKNAIKKESIKQNKIIRLDKKVFHKELSALFSFVAVLIIIFSLVVQKNKFIEFLSFNYFHMYFIATLAVIAFIITALMFIDHIKAKKKEKPRHKIKLNYDIFFLLGMIVVIAAYILYNWVTAVLGLTLMIVSLAAYHMTNKKKEKEGKITKPEKKIPKEMPSRKIKLLLEKPSGGMLAKIREEEKMAKKEEGIERLKLKELQRKVMVEENQRKKEEKHRKKEEKLARAIEIAKQKAIEKEKKKLEKINKSKERILMKEKILGKIQKNRKEIDGIIKMRSSVRSSKYETDFDRLLFLIQKYEKLKISDVAKIFGVSISKAEEWATILEQHKILKIHYPAIGEPELRSMKDEH